MVHYILYFICGCGVVCNAILCFSFLSTHVSSPVRSSGDATPPTSFSFGASVSPPSPLLSAWRRFLSPYRVSLAKSVTNAMQDDMQDCGEWCNLHIACQGRDRDVVRKSEDYKVNDAPRQHPSVMVAGAMAPEDSEHHVGAYAMHFAMWRCA